MICIALAGTAKKVEPEATLTSLTGSRRGFTTIELLVTLMVMVLVSSFVVVAMAPALRDARLRAGCRTVASSLIYARSYAITHRTETRVLLDKSAGAVSVVCRARDERGEETLRPILTQPGRRHIMPDGVKIMSVRKTGVQEEEDYVCFTQFGQSEEAVISIEGASHKERLVTVDAITGRCAVVDGKLVQ